MLLAQGFAFAENGDLTITPLNGRSVQDFTVFTDYDPQLEVKLETPVSWIEISGQISFVKDRMWKSFFDCLTLPQKRPPTREKALCYFDAGNGFRAQDVAAAEPEEQLDGRSKYVFSFPRRVYSLRFDPLEGGGCLVSDFEIRGEPGPYQWISNGVNTALGIVITDPDPQIKVNFQNGTERLTVYAHVERF